MATIETDFKWTPRAIIDILIVNFGLFFQSTCVVLTQVFSIFIYPFSYKNYRKFIAYTMRQWSQNLVAIVQYFAPTDLVLTFDDSCGESMDEILLKDEKGMVEGLSFPNRIIAIANHQIYADWIYIWCVAYLANAHGAVKIILKESLKYLPVYGMKLALDQDNIINNLERSKKNDQPMWLVLFPEGTVVSTCTRKRSKDYAEKNNLKDNRYTLLPRSTGLKLCTATLDNSVEYMYDFTIGYSGIEPTEIPEKVYTIQSIFFFKHFPKHIHIHIRRFKISNIPKENEAFNRWVLDRWVEKDQLMAHFYQNGSFPQPDTKHSDRAISIPVKLKNSLFDLAQYWVFLVPYQLLAIWWSGTRLGEKIGV